MGYVLKGTNNLLTYWNVLGRPCTLTQMANAIGMPIQRLMGSGLDRASYVSRQYSEAQAQALAAFLGTTVANVSASGGQVLL